MTLSIKCNSCKSDNLYLDDICCGICAEKNSEDDTDATLKSVITDCIEAIAFDPEDDGNAGYDPDWPSDEYKAAFLAGVKSARGFAKIQIVCTALDYRIDLQHLLDK